MKRVRRRIVNATIVLSSVLCVMTLCLYARSYWKYDAIALNRMSFHSSGRISPIRYKLNYKYGIGSLDGHIYIFRALSNLLNENHPAVWHFDSLSRPDLAYARLLSAFQRREGHNRYGVHWLWESFDDIGPPLDAGLDVVVHGIILPHLYLIIAFSILPLIAISRLLRNHHRIREGHCVTCGYDLRATPDRCPECGLVPAKEK